MPDLTENRRRPAKLKIAAGLLVLIAAILALNYGTTYLFDRFDLQPWLDRWGGWMFAAGACAFVLLLSLPFVPGMELGVAMMMLLGVRGVVLVYVSALVALSLSFMVGRWIPLWRVAAFLDWFHLRRARAFVERLERLSGEERMNLLLEGSSGRLLPFLIRHRYIAIALVLNMPGNSFIGGGGGIGLLAGVSGIFSYPRYLAMVALAILPLPLIFLAKYTWT